MTNEEIIARKAISEGLFTEEEIIRRIKQDEDIPLHTAKGWSERGYHIRKRRGLPPMETSTLGYGRRSTIL